jgi:hypothetical protein
MTSPAVATTFADLPSPASIGLLDAAFGQALGAAPFWGVDNFGAKGDGVTDDSAAVNAWLAQLAQSGGVGVMTAGKTYYCAKQAVLNLNDGPAQANILILAYGAILTTGANAIYGLLIEGDNIPNRQTVMGLTINQRGSGGAGAGTNAALGGFGLSGTGSVSLVDCSVIANGVPFTGNQQTDYAAFDLFETTPGIDTTGCVWTKILRCWVRKESGSDIGDIPYGVRLRGAANSTTIEHCQITTQGSNDGFLTSAILITIHSGQTYVPNAITVAHNDFESVGYAVQVNAPNGYCTTAFEAFGNRFESIYAAAFYFIGSASISLVPPQIWGGAPLFGQLGFAATGSILATSNVITSVSSSNWQQLFVGQNLQGAGIPINAVVTGFTHRCKLLQFLHCQRLMPLMCRLFQK